MAVIASATVGNYNVEIRDEGSPFRHTLVVERCDGGWWQEIDRKLCPLTPGEAKRAMDCVKTVATPTYERVFRLATAGHK
jgi:hypothetical protein